MSLLCFKTFRFSVVPHEGTSRPVYMSATLTCNLGLRVCLDVCPDLLEATYRLANNGLG